MIKNKITNVSYKKKTMISLPNSPIYTQRTTDTPLGLLFEAVPQLQTACMNASPRAQQAIFSPQKMFLKTAEKIDPRLRQDITSAYLPLRKDGGISEDSYNDPQAQSAYQFDIQGKFKIYQQLKPNRYSVTALVNNQFSAKDFFVSEKRASILKDVIIDINDSQIQYTNEEDPEIKETPQSKSPSSPLYRNQVVNRQDFLVELKNIKNRLTIAFKIMNVKILPSIFQQLLALVVSTKNTLYLAHCLYFCGNLSCRMQIYKYGVYFFDQCRVVCNLNLRELTHLKLDVLVQLGVCTRDMNDYVGSITILKKALQYTWYLNDKIKEPIIYDHIGLAYYYLGNMQQAILYHHRSTHEVSESDTSNLKQVSNEKIRANINYPQEFIQPAFISQGVLNQLNMPYVSLNGQFKIHTESDAPKKSLKRQSVYKEFFKSNRVQLTKSQTMIFTNRIREKDNPSLETMQLDPELIISKLLIDREFQYRAQSPRFFEQDKSKNKRSSGIFYNRKRESNQPIIELGPLPMAINKMLKYDPQKYKMSLEAKIRYRNEEMKIDVPSQEIVFSFGQLSKRVCTTHKSKLRGQFQCKGGLAMDDLVKILESAFQVLLSQLNNL